MLLFFSANLGLSLRSRLKCQVRRTSDSGVDEVESEFLVSLTITSYYISLLLSIKIT